MQQKVLPCDFCYTDDTNCTEGDIRLVGGADDYEGRVEVCHDNVWGTVCDDFWSSNDGRVACGQLGLPFVATTTRASYGEGTGQIWLDNLFCTGSEDQLIDCTHNGFGVHNCIHREDAGLQCGGKLLTLMHMHMYIMHICTYMLKDTAMYFLHIFMQLLQVSV